MWNKKHSVWRKRKDVSLNTAMYLSIQVFNVQFEILGIN